MVNKITHIVFRLLTPLFLFGYWLLPPGHVITPEGLTIQAYVCYIGLGLTLFAYSILNVLNSKEWSKVELYLSWSGVIQSFFILIQFIRMYWTGGGFDWTDIVIGFGGVPFIIGSIILIRKLIPKQKEVEKYIHYNRETQDVAGNILTQITLHKELQRMKENVFKLDGEEYVLMSGKLLDECEQKYRKQVENIRKNM